MNAAGATIAGSFTKWRQVGESNPYGTDRQSGDLPMVQLGINSWMKLGLLPHRL
jgi:hypothetical protein